MDIELVFMRATEVADRIRRRELSAVEHVEAVLAAIETWQPHINAFVTVSADAARAAARAADQRVADGSALGSLHGVAVSVKDLVDVAGLPCKKGSRLHADDVPREDAPAVARLRDAGAIVVGKTTTPELGHKALTDSLLDGVTRNPWDLARTPGGSSGGASAAVAAGLGPLAVGTDGAGSIRGPAASAGIVGLKPTRGAVPHHGAGDPFGNQSFTGPMTRTVADAAHMLAVMAGPHADDPFSLGGRLEAPDPRRIAGDLAGLSIGYAERMANPEVDPAVVANTEASLSALEALGARVEPLPDGFDWCEPAGRVLYQSGIAARVLPLLAQSRADLTPSLVRFAEWGERWTARDVAAAVAARGDLYRRVQALLGRHDVLVSPTTACTALAADFDATADVVINGRPCGITRQSWTAYQYPFNLTGHPAVSVPSGFAPDGLPTGLQIVGRWWRDLDVLAVAAALERARPWAARRPRLPAT
ncbi:MAG: amidase [Ectothiorhodospiraceae bacterium]|nr:amidase [Chromatiales bacterium]MCP5153958.1 amidase [Ectothiorhodospiraceae bacterium]